MTDNETPFSDERVDLRALDLDVPDRHGDAIVGSVMARIHATRREADAIVRLRLMRRPMLAVTAALAGLAATLLLMAPSDAGSSENDPLLEWVESNHTPSNAELLRAFQGYAP